MHSIVEKKIIKNDIKDKNVIAFDYSINVLRNVMKMIGAWPLNENSTKFEKIYKYFSNVICYFFLIFFFVPSVLYVIFIPQSIKTKIKMSATIFTCLANAVKYTLLLKHSEQIYICLLRTKEDWLRVDLKQDYKSMLSRGKLGRTLVILSAFLIYGGNMFYRTVLPLVRGKMIVNNVTIRPLACPGYYVIFDEQKSPAYELVFLGNVLSGLIVYSIALAVCALTTFLVLHGCGQLEILIRKMKDIETVDSNFKADELILKIILHQTKTRSFIKKVSEIVQYMCLAEVASCTYVTCIALYALALEHYNATSIITYTVLIVSFTYYLFIFCYIGELLADQNTKVIETSSTLDWHNLVLKSAKDLILIILVSNDPPKLVAGKILDLSLSNFTSMCKTAVGYFNILRKTL